MTDDSAAGGFWQPPADPTQTPAEPPSGGPQQPAGPSPIWASSYGSPAASSDRPSRGTGLKIALAVLLVVALVGAGVGTFFGTRTHSRNQSGSAANAAPGSPSAPPPSAAASGAGSGPGSGAPSSPAKSGEPSAPALSQVSPPGPLDGYVLSDAELGTRAPITLIPGGRDVSGQATLDFCNFAYTSEQDRTARVQVSYDLGAQSVSNEFVRYRAGGATLAYAEIQKAASTCPPSFTDSDGSTIGNVSILTHTPGLVPHQLLITSSATDSAFGISQVQWTVAVYQFDGNYFSGVYVFGTNHDAVVQEAQQLGVIAARHLAQAAAGKHGTGGGTIYAPDQSGDGGGGGNSGNGGGGIQT